jgi:hypothetical protein
MVQLFRALAELLCLAKKPKHTATQLLRCNSSTIELLRAECVAILQLASIALQ